ncbi:zinc transporter ZIP1 [Aplysia californica]|uniref:Zinc transporter ZIP1 n=1 Tax=Aplysia californica TaxID=6500 RepID=A0ABM0JC92_APLCA|nr:zinc transporter ZIP1 [Aplysia californica]
MAISVDVVKVIVLAGLLVMTFLFGMIPVFIINVVKKASHRNRSDSSSNMETADQRSRLSSYKRVLSFLNCLAAGVFLATCFLDLLPSVQRNLIQVLYDMKVYTGFPVAEFILVIGLFIILIIEQIVLTIKERPAVVQEENDPRQPLLGHQEENKDEMIESYHSDYSIGGICDEPHVTVTEGAGADAVHSEKVSRTRRQKVGGTQAGIQAEETDDSVSGGASFHREHANEEHGHHQRHSPADHSLQVHSPLRTLLLLLALSLHSVFEGLTIGLQLSVGEVLGIFAALVLHKSILSFSLGMNLVQSKLSVKSAIKSVVVFSLSSPVGIAIGITITDLWDSVSSGLIHGLLQGIASGTFLYIIFFEILPKEFNCESDRLLKVLCLIVGFAAVTGILFLDEDVKKPFCVIRESEKP